MRRIPSTLFGAAPVLLALAMAACNGPTDRAPDLGGSAPSAVQHGLSVQQPSSEGPASNPGSPGAQAPTAPSTARAWYVSPNGNDAASGAQDAPFRTIGKALSVIGPGEVIYVQAGRYAEELVFDKDVVVEPTVAPQPAGR